MNRVTLAIILLFGTALTLYWQVQSKKASQPQLTDSVQKPDYVATDLRSISYNAEGKLESRVSASYMEHFDGDAQTLFTQPVYTLFPEDGQGEWRLTAKTGRLDKVSDEVMLEEEVLIEALTIDEPLQQLNTSYLELDLKTMILTSDKEIIISGNNFHLSGHGLYADLNAKEVKLLSKIKGTYEPK
ncbi:LPS export ABC transporter periplasmic protein LptC [Shewanella sp. FJAT-52076]|uniref:LPS export ABC transporter periplasmic protein LptC n=1 Tax=Shewanella sp. FJAT-52076 TaxID=2864202 RepID=UPI001C65A5BE|nr:LPS export ABC transporter periplasmic protein LptC [Shewanella sp. FJAT-52076]QYJ74841.1 LPS export ABC transporter periplasmic protein LptC [Shewanella sp. FJAT-52076]